MKSSALKSVKIAGMEVKRSCHACAFFHSREEYYEVLLPFIKEGFELGDKAFHVLDQSDHGQHLERLGQVDILVDESRESGQFELKSWEAAYLEPGHFSQDAMLELLEAVLKESKAKGYAMTRLVANMEWACKHDIPGVKDLVKYETRLNRFLPNYDDVVVCTYDLNVHRASVVIDILRTHPYVLIGGIMHENPYFVQPDELLRELEQREALT